MLAWLLLFAQDPIQDPASGWKDFGVGSWVRTKTVTKLDDKAESATESKLTLTERTKEALVFEHEFTALRETRRERRELPIKPPRKGPVLRVKETSRGEEDLTVDGKTLRCRWVESDVESTEGGSTSKAVVRVWTCAEVPGSVARMRVKVLQPSPFEMETDVLSFEKK